MMGGRAVGWIAALLAAAALHAAVFAFLPETRSPAQPGTRNDTLRIQLGSVPVDTPQTAEQTPQPERPEPTQPAEPSVPETATASAKAMESPVPTEPDPSVEAPDAGAATEPQSSDPHQPTAPPTTGSTDSTDSTGETTPEAGDAEARRDYLLTLRAWLAEHRRYPRRARLRGVEGEAVLTLHFNANGALASGHVSQGSGHASLDNAVKAMLSRARPLPSPPDDAAIAGRRIEIPISFSLASDR